MPRKIIQTTDEEVKSIYGLALEYARKEKSYRVQIPHDKLKEVLLDPDDLRRVNQMCGSKLRDMGVSVVYRADGYIFNISKSEDIGLNKVTVNSDRSIVIGDDIEEQFTTQTQFDTEYILPAIYRDVRLALQDGRFNPLIIGPASCGKSRLFEELAARSKTRGIRRPLSQIEDQAELIGTTQVVVRDGIPRTEHVDGMITLCARKGYFCILDEYDNASPAANEALKMVSEDGGCIVIETHEGTVEIKKHPMFRLCFTSNTRGFGDATGLFPNAQVQNAASMSRLHPKFEMDYEIPVERKVCESLGCPKIVLDALFLTEEEANATGKNEGIVVKTRRTIKDQGIRTCLSFRSLIAFSMSLEMYGWNKAFKYNICNSFPEEFEKSVIEDVISVVGPWAEPTNDMSIIKAYEDDIKSHGFPLPQ